MMLAVVAAVFCWLGIDVAYAQRYERGDWACADFEEARQYYQSEQNILNTYIYARCLVIKGDDANGLSLMNHLVDRYNETAATHFLGHYIESNGEFVLTAERHWKHTGLLDKAIAVHHRTLAFINGRSYPKDVWTDESIGFRELDAYGHLLHLHLQKFQAGYIGHENWHLNHSPSFEGDKNRPSYPEYREYTEDTLKKTRDIAGTCLLLRQKPEFDASKYSRTLAHCRLAKDIAERLLPLERERLNLTFQDSSCRSNVFECEEYLDLKQAIAGTLDLYQW